MTENEKRTEGETAGERDAEEGIAGYGQAPAGVRTTQPENGPEYDWGKKQTPPATKPEADAPVPPGKSD